MSGSDEPPDIEAVADAMGAQVITVVSVHRPGRFPTRVFYTRQWRDPDGKLFGKGNLRVLSIHHFRTLTRGYRHEFRLVQVEATA